MQARAIECDPQMSRFAISEYSGVWLLAGWSALWDWGRMNSCLFLPKFLLSSLSWEELHSHDDTCTPTGNQPGDGKKENPKHAFLCISCLKCSTHIGSSAATWDLFLPPVQMDASYELAHSVVSIGSSALVQVVSPLLELSQAIWTCLVERQEGIFLEQCEGLE